MTLSIDDIDQLGELLASMPEPFMPMEADMLDGYLTAIALLKCPPPVEDWLSFIFDMQGNTRAKLPNAQRHAQLRKLIFARGEEIEQQLLSEKPIDPIIYEDEGTDEEDGNFSALAPFSDGFAFACANWPELMKNENPAVQAALIGILRYESAPEDASAADDDHERAIMNEIEEEMAFANLDEALADLTACVQEIAEVTRQGDIERAQTQMKKKRIRHR